LDGLGFLKQVMAKRPTPIVVCSGLTERGAQASMAALAAGAVAVFPKTALRSGSDGGAELVRLVRAAAGSKVASPAALSAPVEPHHPVPRAAPRPGARVAEVVAIGASTGGPQSLEVVLSALGVGCPPLVIVQHMPEKFTKAFADRLDALSDLEVREAQGAEVLKPGLAFIAPGGRHLQVRRVNGELVTEVFDAPPSTGTAPASTCCSARWQSWPA
jgi:two-component system chemotaxis response regulator CheB